MGEGYGRSSFCSLCTSENSLSKLDFQVLNNGIVGTVMIHKLFFFFFFLKKKKNLLILYWGIANHQCCDSFR